jgi:hypothetical protein
MPLKKLGTMKMKPDCGSTELEKFNTVLRKVLSVPREELKRREAEWKRNRAQKKRAKTSPASRASTSKG